MAIHRPIATKPLIATKNAPQNTGLIVAWKDGMVLSSLGKETDKKTYEEKAREESISTGLDHAMDLLGELHKNECDSFLCTGERVSKTLTLIRTLPPPIAEQSPPTCPQPHLWDEQCKECLGHPTNHHRVTWTNDASPGKAVNGTLGSCLHDKCTNDASPGKAANCTLGGSHHHAMLLKCLAKNQKAENPIQKPITTDGI
jgi:hypothetical protein